jgi:hypothetical protein
MSYRCVSIRTVIVMLSLVVFGAGAASECYAGKPVKRKAKSKLVRKLKQAADTVVPAPLVDDTPINPGTAKPDSSAADSTAAKRSAPAKKGAK